MRALLPLSGLVLAACGAAAPAPRPLADLHQYAPPMVAVAQLPLHSNVGSVYQDYSGPAYAVHAAPPANETGGEGIPSFPVGGSSITQGPRQVIVPNGGERPIRSTNALP